MVWVLWIKRNFFDQLYVYSPDETKHLVDKMGSERVDYVYGPMSNRMDGTFAEWVPPPEEEPSMEELKKTNRRLAGDVVTGWKKLEAKDAELAEAQRQIRRLKKVVADWKSTFDARVEAIERDNEGLSYMVADLKEEIARLRAAAAKKE